MKKTLTLLFLMGANLASCTSGHTAAPQSDELTMLVGTYTNSGTSRGIYTFRFNQQTGIFMMLDSFALPNPSFLVSSTNGTQIYAVSEMPDSSAMLSALTLDRQNGKLRLINSRKTVGEDPCHVSTNGQCTLTSNYSGGSLSVFSLNGNGGLDTLVACFNGNTGGPDLKRQSIPHIHCTQFSPDDKYVFATDFSADQLLRFPIQTNGKKLLPADAVFGIEPGSGPRHFIFNSAGNRIYLISELSGKITVFDYDNGILEQRQSILADSVAARGSADIHLSPDGRFLYASNRLKNDGLAIFSVNEDGSLLPIGYQHTEVHPRNFNITPNGKFLLVACKDSNIIQIFELNITNGLLTNTGQKIVIGQPVCIQFTP